MTSRSVSTDFGLGFEHVEEAHHMTSGVGVCMVQSAAVSGDESCKQPHAYRTANVWTRQTHRGSASYQLQLRSCATLLQASAAGGLFPLHSVFRGPEWPVGKVIGVGSILSGVSKHLSMENGSSSWMALHLDRNRCSKKFETGPYGIAGKTCARLRA